jgi:hypothetical protein
MSYYLLPKKLKIPEIEVSYTEGDDIPHNVSFSLNHYLKVYNTTIENYNLKKKINPYTFLNTMVDDSNISVSKFINMHDHFFSLIEILSILNLQDIKLNETKTLFCCNSNYRNQLINILNPISNYEIDDLSEYQPIEGLNNSSLNFIYFETNENETQLYLRELLRALRYINKYQEINGNCVIKIGKLYSKPILEIVYIFTSMFDSVYVIKPNASFIFNDDRYLVCKHFIKKSPIIHFNEKTNNQISSIIKETLPIYFLNKIEDSNIIIGHTQLEYYDMLIATIKHRNIDEKLETIKKNNLQKCMQWCEKYNIPYNKFVDKLNIFLNFQQDDSADT